MCISEPDTGEVKHGSCPVTWGWLRGFPLEMPSLLTSLTLSCMLCSRPLVMVRGWSGAKGPVTSWALPYNLGLYQCRLRGAVEEAISLLGCSRGLRLLG